MGYIDDYTDDEGYVDMGGYSIKVTKSVDMGGYDISEPVRNQHVHIHDNGDCNPIKDNPPSDDFDNYNDREEQIDHSGEGKEYFD